MKRSHFFVRSGNVLVCALLSLVLSLSSLNNFVSVKADEGNIMTVTENGDGTITTDTIEKKSDGTVVNTIITIDEDGTVLKTQIITQKITKKGNLTKITKSEDIDGTKIEINEVEYLSGKKKMEGSSTSVDGAKAYQYEEWNPDGSGKSLSEMTEPDGTVWYSEQSANKDGSSVSIGKAYDLQGNSKIMETRTDADGNSVTITQQEEADGYRRYYKHIENIDGSETLYEEKIRSEGDSSIYKIVRDKDDNSHVWYVKYSADGKEAVIPGKLWSSMAVNVIDKKAFKNNKDLESIIIESDKITEVGKQAFKGISTDVTIKIKANKSDYKRIVKLIKKSGISKKVKLKRI